jgi:hypothetical protein
MRRFMRWWTGLTAPQQLRVRIPVILMGVALVILGDRGRVLDDGHRIAFWVGFALLVVAAVVRFKPFRGSDRRRQDSD